MATPDGPDVVMAILAGDLDDDLTDVHQAIKRRVAESQTRVCWRVDFDGVEVTEENQTMNEVETVERTTGKRWGMFSPYNSAVECAAIITAALVHRSNMKASEAAELIGKRPATELMACLTEYVLTDAPKDEASVTP